MTKNDKKTLKIRVWSFVNAVLVLFYPITIVILKNQVVFKYLYGKTVFASFTLLTIYLIFYSSIYSKTYIIYLLILINFPLFPLYFLLYHNWSTRCFRHAFEYDFWDIQDIKAYYKLNKSLLFYFFNENSINNSYHSHSNYF